MKKGFTLAELLIALAILAIIAVFTIPKVLTNQQNASKKALSKEAANTIANAYRLYTMDHTATAGTGPDNLLPYLNYLQVDTNSSHQIDGSGGVMTCGDASASKCIRLQNGGVLAYYSVISFGGTNSNNAIWFVFDPDGQQNGSGYATLFLYYTGRITSWSTIVNNTVTGLDGGSPRNTCPACDPSWFSWN